MYARACVCLCVCVCMCYQYLHAPFSFPSPPISFAKHIPIYLPHFSRTFAAIPATASFRDVAVQLTAYQKRASFLIKAANEAINHKVSTMLLNQCMYCLTDKCEKE